MAKSPWISDLHWVRVGSQARSQRTQAALLDAAEVLFFDKGVEATSVADVAARAGSSVGAVYHHFRDKKALVYAFFDRLAAEFHATTLDAVDPARWEGASIADVLKGYLEFSLEIGRARPGVHRAGLEVSLRDPTVRENLSEVRAELDRGLAALVLARRSEIGHHDPAMACAFVLDQLGCMVRNRLEGDPGASPFETRSDEDFVREALASVGAYLQLRSPREAKAKEQTQ
ncbi:MAG: helix-turn-helix domain-containing protein [Myxococcota bacterium]|nr:helix-turn-helix domain-containing protein [Myxococcota bacterium]